MLRRIAAVVLPVVVCTGCVIDEPMIERTDGSAATAVVPTVAFPSVTPLPAPTAAVPTAAPTADVEPTATPSPAPTPTPPPPSPTPLPTTEPAIDVEPTIRAPGIVTVPVNGTSSFELRRPRPILQLPGHALIYVDTDRQGEVDLFTPVADANGDPIGGYIDVVAIVQNDPNLAGLSELPQTTVDGFSARVFDGTATLGVRVFFTDAGFTDNENAGWSPPLRLRMWIIDHPRGPVILTAESLEDPGQFDESLSIANGLLSTIDLG